MNELFFSSSITLDQYKVVEVVATCFFKEVHINWRFSFLYIGILRQIIHVELMIEGLKLKFSIDNEFANRFATESYRVN